ncbi:flagellar biosynthesis protein [Litorivivens lipolytica]|uniref:Flagellar biosynthetic protein FlhB n=1 Tax=Litorivivens lipolytica TaxID=1524264 RepID=A0A7W4W387_9GAMM|nr:EscU/YscU/HrcU family type III secretion system export apparatus switch protein [Litorivivens lipolytica]MBB3046348.1 flagellar biosynthesis protein [Litorivivens lipolytica]
MKKTNPPRTATALEYDGYRAPRVTAQGEDALADKILKLADEHDIPIRRDPKLAALLSQVDIGDEIPALLYVAVAEALAFAYTLQDELNWIEPE